MTQLGTAGFWKYRPILLDKLAEMHALASLGDAVRSRMHPIIQLRHPEPPKGAGRNWNPLSKLLDSIQDSDRGIVGCWGTDQPIALDLRDLKVDQFDESPLDMVFERCADLGVQAVPVTGRGLSEHARLAAAQAARRLGHGACIRLVEEEMKVGIRGIQGLLTELDIPRASTDLVFDLANLPDGSVFLLSELVGTYLSRFGPMDAWRSISVTGSSFPQNLSERVAHNSFDLLPRNELLLWERVSQGHPLPSVPDFGDYGVASANPPPAFRGAANLRYATPSGRWYVLRGDSPETAPKDYLRLAEQLLGSDIWHGSNHCAGCEFIQAQVNHQRPGNATQWREAGFAHHFAVTVRGLS